MENTYNYHIVATRSNLMRLRNEKNEDIRTIKISDYKRSKRTNRKLRKPIHVFIDKVLHTFTSNEWNNNKK